LRKSGSNDGIYSIRVRAGKRTYFFDVKATRSQKDYYITITESKRVGEDIYEKHKIFLYKEDMDKFANALMDTADFVQARAQEIPETEPVAEEVDHNK
jgi:hypothetical protein